MDVSSIVATLNELFDRIPRRHNPDNVKEMYAILDEYEDQLRGLEGLSPEWEQKVAPIFDQLDPIRALVKKSSDNKASKKMKDDYFGEASGELKDAVEAAIALGKSA